MEGLFYLGMGLFGLGIMGIVLNRENLLLVSVDEFRVGIFVYFVDLG